jgi:predicted AAA+ superfamily ATPase
MEETLFRFNPWWENQYLPQLISRPGYMNKMIESLQSNRIMLISGLRRVGKTSLMKLTIQHIIKSLNTVPHKILYVSLDDYNLKNYTILEIVDEFRKIHSIKFTEKIFVFLDEVTYKNDYEIQLKNLFDTQHVKVFASSSASSLLINRKHHITGRNQIMEILPLDFSEFLSFKNIKISRGDPHILENEFENFLKTGGIPEYVLTGDSAYLHELVDDIIMKDIAAMHNIKQPSILKDLFMLFMERSGKQVSFNKLGAILGISVDTVSRYVNLFQQANLIYLVNRHGKTNERLLSPRKIYAPDVGIRVYYTGFRDKGSLFENYVYLMVKDFNPSYIYQNQTEIDFILENGTVLEAKYHQEAISEKQKILLEKYCNGQYQIIRSHEDLQNFLNTL